ncbi:hypothetical protein [Faucicola atlantae]|uniref:hypothetical protein n=1 Tax=Faucicola atlantae TaxID=34059 RepID=UPI0025B24572|nr:hypothetical protein [Moraxella atlantae]
MHHQNEPTTAGGMTRNQSDYAHLTEKETITLSAFELSQIACDFYGMYEALNDMGALLHMIYSNKLDHHQAQNMARLAHCTVEAWADNAFAQITKLNKDLCQTRFGAVKLTP